MQTHSKLKGERELELEHTHTPANSIFSGPLTRLLSMLCVLMKILHVTVQKQKTKRLKGFRFCIFIGSFQVTSWQ